MQAHAVDSSENNIINETNGTFAYRVSELVRKKPRGLGSRLVYQREREKLGDAIPTFDDVFRREVVITNPVKGQRPKERKLIEVVQLLEQQVLLFTGVLITDADGKTAVSNFS